VNGARALIAVVAVFVSVLIWIWRANHHGRRRVTGRRATLSELLEPVRCDPVTHLIPAEGEGEYLTLCCKSDPFALIAEHHVMVVRPEQVTCDRSGGEA
jgi:hypothetical protein